MYTKNRLCAILVVLCLTFLLVSCTGPRQKAELIGVVVTQGATGVFNYAPIKATFSAEPEGVSVRTTPRVSGTTLFRGNRVIFVPGERYQPNTEYTVTFTWTEGEARVAFLSANEITEHYQTHFNEYQKGEAPHDW
ncbi:MAG: Ig-like domain-containing protein, partial [Limnochordia bacterium]